MFLVMMNILNFFFLQSKEELECANIDIDCDVDDNVHKIMNQVELNELDKVQEES